MPVRYTLTVLTLIAAIAGPAAAQDGAAPAPQDDEVFQTQITIGRLPALVDRADTVLQDVKDARPPVLDGVDAASLYGSLYRAWLGLERLRADACEDAVLTGEVCAARFEPDWLRPPGSFAPTLSEVTQWGEELQGAVLEVTDPICAQAPPDAEGPGACSVE